MNGVNWVGWEHFLRLCSNSEWHILLETWHHSLSIFRFFQARGKKCEICRLEPMNRGVESKERARDEGLVWNTFLFFFAIVAHFYLFSLWIKVAITLSKTVNLFVLEFIFCTLFVVLNHAYDKQNNRLWWTEISICIVKKSGHYFLLHTLFTELISCAACRSLQAKQKYRTNCLFFFHLPPAICILMLVCLCF